MATVFSHALVGCTVLNLAAPEQFKNKRNYFIAGLTAMLPDIDYLGYVKHIPYESFWGHRGFTHSIVFSLGVGVFTAFALNRKLNLRFLGLWILFFFTTLSHPLVDAFTNGGLGVAFFSPYTTLRYFFPWTPIQVSPMGLGVFSQRGLAVALSEVYWIVLPCLLIFAIKKASQYPDITKKS